MPDAPKVRFRVDFGSQCSIGVGKIELLEAIARSGSLSEAARQMRMSYRRAWLLLADLNASFDQPVVHTSAGGRGGGGAVLTAFGARLVAGYRKLDSCVQPLAQSCLSELGKRVVVTRAKKPIHPSSLRRKSNSAEPMVRRVVKVL
jgi:molybdate transport system regulatory protein